MSKRYAVVNKEGKVVNCILWDGVTQWSPPESHVAIRHDECSTDDYWDFDKKQLHKVCRLNGCEDKSHTSDRVHTEFTLAEHVDAKE